MIANGVIADKYTKFDIDSKSGSNGVILEDIYGITPPIFVGLAIALGVGVSTFALSYNQNINFYGYKNPADLDLKYSIGGTRTFKLKVTKTARKSFWYSG